MLIGAVPAPTSVKDFVRGCYKVFDEIYVRFCKVKNNDNFRKHVEEKIEELKKLVQYLETVELLEFPQVCAERLQKFNESLKKCWEKCEELHRKGFLKNFVFVDDYASELQYMEKHLKEANIHLQSTVSVIQMQQTKEGFVQTNANMKEGLAQANASINKGNSQIVRVLYNPDEGVYRGESADNQSPSVISAPSLCEDRDAKLMIIRWHDTNNSMKKIEKYEVQYADDRVVHGTPKDLSICGSDTKFVMKLGYPKVVEKRSYTVKVRAVKMDSPGPWSEPSTILYLCDRPGKPKMPDLKVFSPTQVVVEIQLLNEHEMNGSEVQSCAVEYMQATAQKNPVWERCIYNLKLLRSFGEKVTMTMESLKPDTRYNFRVIMINEIGESQPSNENEILTHQLTPGIPQNLRISSKRTDKTIKIRWEPPLENPQVVQRYHAQIRRAKSKPDSWNTIPVPIDAINKFSAKATNLNTNTRYLFRVQAFNDRGESGGFTNSAEGETRVGKAARIAAATGAFFGGTIGGPIIGAAAGGMAAADSNKSKTAAVAKGVGGGIGGVILGAIGAPVVGGAAAFTAYTCLKDGLVDGVDSPQTSDDEETKEWYRKRAAENSESS